MKVALTAGPGNPTGLGAVIRAVYDNHKGPAMEHRAGEGYWSQSGGLVVPRRNGTLTAIEVRWPGGKSETWPVSPEQKTLRLEMGKSR